MHSSNLPFLRFPPLLCACRGTRLYCHSNPAVVVSLRRKEDSPPFSLGSRPLSPSRCLRGARVACLVISSHLISTLGTACRSTNPTTQNKRLENRQRHKIEEQEADLSRLKAEMASLKRDHDRLLAENGRFSDSVGELQSQLRSVGDSCSR